MLTLLLGPPLQNSSPISLLLLMLLKEPAKPEQRVLHIMEMMHLEHCQQHPPAKKEQEPHP